MITALDTNILSTLLAGGSASGDVSKRLLDARREGALVLSGVVYTELLAAPHISEPLLKRLLSKTEIEVEFSLSAEVWTLAGTRFRQYAERRRHSTKEGPRRLVADFLIGAHALLRADRLMTFDARWYTQDFPDLRLY